jgi:hypothetical protein
MRILRAILLRQIQVVTRRFADHDIELVALVWDGNIDATEKMWADATMGLPEHIERHLAAIASCNRAT